MLAEGLQKRRVHDLGITGHFEQVVQTLKQLGGGQSFGAQFAPGCGWQWVELGLFQAVSQAMISGQDGGEDGTGIQLSARQEPEPVGGGTLVSFTVKIFSEYFKAHHDIDGIYTFIGWDSVDSRRV